MTKPTWGHMYSCGSCIRKTWIQWFSGPWTERRSQLNQNKMKGLANPGLRCGCTFIVNLPKTQAASTAGWAPKGFGRGEYLKQWYSNLLILQDQKYIQKDFCAFAILYTELGSHGKTSKHFKTQMNFEVCSMKSPLRGRNATDTHPEYTWVSSS